MEETGYQNIDEYIALFPPDVAQRMIQIRKLIRETSPKATEKISWRMPTFYLNGNLIHFAGFKSHIGIYPGAEGVAAFEDRLADYHHSKGAIQLPHGKPLPMDLIRDIVKFRTAQNEGL